MVNLSSSRRSSRRNKSINAINVTPFVDVMLVLLIIFMITSPMLVSGINVNLPKEATKSIQGQDEPISVTVNKHGNVYINNTPIDAKSLIVKLKYIAKEKYNTRIIIRGDKSTAYENVVHVLNSINDAGFHKVALQTEAD